MKLKPFTFFIVITLLNALITTDTKTSSEANYFNYASLPKQTPLTHNNTQVPVKTNIIWEQHKPNYTNNTTAQPLDFLNNNGITYGSSYKTSTFNTTPPTPHTTYNSLSFQNTTKEFKIQNHVQAINNCEVETGDFDGSFEYLKSKTYLKLETNPDKPNKKVYKENSINDSITPNPWSTPVSIDITPSKTYKNTAELEAQIGVDKPNEPIYTNLIKTQLLCFKSQQIISTEANGAQDVYVADLDGDGNVDVLSASLYDHKIAWYKNDGSGNFGKQQIISIEAKGGVSVYAADLDADGDIDVLSASFHDDRITWYKNDGSGSFGTGQIISTEVDGAQDVYVADLDADGDIDVLSASLYDDKIAWYKNDGKGNFGKQQIISTAADRAQFVYAADLDADGDIDVLSASWNDNKIAWYKNDGKGNFGPEQIISTAANGAHSVYTADLDADGDIDVLSASWNDHKIAWYKNDGKGNFGKQQIISIKSKGAYSVYATDLDKDGNIDVLSASGIDNKIAWYKNDDGLGNFGPEQIISTAANRAHSVYAADLDKDGNIDVLSASEFDHKIAWYKNSINDSTSPTGDQTQQFCKVNSPTLDNLQVNGTDIKWYASVTATTPL
ncbi:MAG: FG-GAP repeat domain-containing protein, partial [Tenacibaculum sp.]